MKPRTLLLIRRIVQFLFFVFFLIFVVGTVCAFSLGDKQALSCTVGTIQVVISGAVITGTLIVTGLVMVALTILLGRVFCSWMC
ncbi:MAG: 4Fe-4S binding protein, partial [Clostridiales bacterium]|nr:4Fe-4S binding protein [Clostridiales bacterium]